jgi:predicted RNA-binding Zn ribbon-like protein
MAHDVNDPAPGALRLVHRFVNTLDIEAGTDALDAAWLESVGLPGGDAERARLFREALRELLLGHNGVPVAPRAVALLTGFARESPVVVGFAADGTPRLEGSDAVSHLLAAIARAELDGTWERLKICPADDCRWAFYDFSRNRSRTWCDMKVCGNRAKARTYRSKR